MWKHKINKEPLENKLIPIGETLINLTYVKNLTKEDYADNYRIIVQYADNELFTVHYDNKKTRDEEFENIRELYW